MAQLRSHPNSKLDHVADYYYRLGYDAAHQPKGEASNVNETSILGGNVNHAHQPEETP